MSLSPTPRPRLLERQLTEARDESGALDVERLLDLVGDTYAEQERARRERRAAEDALRAARDAAQAASQAKSAFLAAMSHEIRTPLNGVLGTAGALAQTGLSSEQAQMVRVMLESGDLLTTILSDILDLAKIEAGRLQLESAPFEPRTVISSVLELYKSTAAAKGLWLSAELGAGLDQWVVGDAGRLRQVAQNLLSNALKFTAEGSVILRARAEPGRTGPRLLVEVVDTGCGVPPEAQSRLFTRFSQADSSTTRRFGGTGLGLALCRELVGAMGGDIGMRSSDSGGSCFWFTLPLQLDGTVADTPDPQAAEPGRLVGGMRVLGVDDNATNRFVLRAVLEAAGCTVELAENGEEAVRAAVATDFDAILMDVHMPVMDGLDATRAIRALGGRHAATPIIAVTAEALPEQVERAGAAGMNRHVTKPIRPDRLLEALADAIAEASAALSSARSAEALSRVASDPAGTPGKRRARQG